MRRQRPTIWTATLVSIIVVGMIYGSLLLWFLPLNGLWSGDQGAKVLQIVSLIRERMQGDGIPYPGVVYDPEQRFSPLPALYTWPRNGVSYSIFSYPYAALTAPGFFLFGYAGLYVVPVLATLAGLACAASLSARLGFRPIWTVPLIIGLATPLAFYALVLWEHALAVAFTTGALLWALFALERRRAAQPWAAALAGLLAGGAWWFRAECLLLGPALLVALAVAGVGRRGLLWASAGLAVGLLPMVGFNLAFFGLPLGPQVARNYGVTDAAKLAALLASRGPIAATMLLAGPGSLLWPGVALALAVGAAPAQRLRPWLLLAAAMVVLAYLLGPGAGRLHTGLIIACPLILLTPVAANREMLRRPDMRLVLATAFLFAGGVLLTTPNDGGAQWGPRYLLPVVPMLVPAGLAAIMRGPPDQGARRVLSLTLALLLIGGLVAQVQGLQTYRYEALRSLRIVQVVNARPAPVVLTDIWYAPQLIAPLYFERTILMIHRSEDLPVLTARLHEHGITQFGYLTVRPWDKTTTLPPGSGARCTRVEGLGYGLTLLDCAIATGH